MKCTFKMLVSVAAAAMIFLQACHSEKCSPALSKEDSVKIAVYDKLFATDSIAGAKLFHMPVPVRTVRPFIYAYKAIYEKSSDDNINLMKKGAHTEYVSFKSPELIKWISNLPSGANIDNIRVYFGVYTEDTIPPSQYNSTAIPVKKGRLMVALWPYSGNTPAFTKITKITADRVDTTFVDPYDIGDVHP